MGIDISQEMISQFKRRCANSPNTKIIHARFDKSLPFKKSLTRFLFLL
jgi:primosomal protein N''